MCSDFFFLKFNVLMINIYEICIVWKILIIDMVVRASKLSLAKTLSLPHTKKPGNNCFQITIMVGINMGCLLRGLLAWFATKNFGKQPLPTQNQNLCLCQKKLTMVSCQEFKFSKS